MVTMIRNLCAKGGNRAAYGIKQDGKWIMTSYNDYYKQIRTVSLELLVL
jgi:hypothetical protein